MNLRRGLIVQCSGVYSPLTSDYLYESGKTANRSIQQVRSNFAFYDTSTLYLRKVLDLYFDAITRHPYHQM